MKRARQQETRELIVSDTKQFVFIHNPKCAGVSFRGALKRFDTAADYFWNFSEWNGQRIDKAHLPLFLLQSAYPAYFEKLQRYFTFMVVRNPFTRAVSAFNEAKYDVYDAFISSGDMSRYRYELNRFLTDLTAEHLIGWQFGYRHFVPQHRFAFLGKKRLVDVVLRLEDLPQDLEKISLFDPEVADALKAAPKSHHRPLDVAIDRLLDHRSIKNIVDLYAGDFLLFDYPKTVIEQQPRH